jgi:hypothetical protein
MRARSIARFGLLSLAGICLSRGARADDAPANAPWIPVVIEAGSEIVSLDDMRCIRASCEGQVPPGRHTIKLELLKDGEWTETYSRDIDIVAPTLIRVEGPGLLRQTAVVTLAAGAAIVAAGVILPLVLCQASERVDPVTGQVYRHYPCDGVSDGVKIGWIAGVGIGLTLVMLGAIGFATTSGATRVTTRRWALLPILAPIPHDQHGRLGAAIGLGLVARF